MSSGYVYRWKANEPPQIDSQGNAPGVDNITVTGASADQGAVEAMLKKAGAVPLNGYGPWTVSYAALLAAYNGSTYAVLFCPQRHVLGHGARKPRRSPAGRPHSRVIRSAILGPPKTPSRLPAALRWPATAKWTKPMTRLACF